MNMFQYGLVHVGLIMITVYMFGLILGPVMCVIIVGVIDLVLGILGWERVSYMDLGFAMEMKCDNNHMGGYMEIDKISYYEFKGVFIERALARIGKLRKVLIKRLGFYLWKDVDMSLAIDQILKDDTVLKSHDEIVDYICKINSQKLDRSRPLWQFRVVENYTNSTSLIIYKIHHSVLDGVGLASLMSAINDEQFTSRLNRAIIKPSFTEKIRYALNTPIILAKIMTGTVELCSDKNAEKLTEVNGDNHYSNKYLSTKEYDFELIKKAYKKYPGMTFNDFLLGVSGKSYHQWFKENGVKDAEKIGF